MGLRLGIALVSILTISSMSCTRQGAVKLETTEQKASYAIGRQIGENLKRQNVDLETKVLAAAIQDAIDGSEPRISQEEMQQALQDLQQTQMKKRQEEAEEQKKKGEEFLAQNKEKEGVKTTESGLQYRVIEEGNGASPTEKDTVVAHYKGTLVDGTEFDSSHSRGKPAEFPVRGVIPGWTEALQMMKVGAKWELFIPAELAYGAAGRPGIPPNSVLIFEVELIEIKDGADGQ